MFLNREERRRFQNDVPGTRKAKPAQNIIGVFNIVGRDFACRRTVYSSDFPLISQKS
jgi:hypothetical protein